ncbi:hypothetical protein A2480_02340 [Candidatus Uhrbacteria bacterium RIFOXYC2_FULL_47_19]|uniref:Thioredoxin domain-containing protein n=1 Tax=Candidatus Uhrbacteria bacterium RIFOXYC2_FULL_47_19 TaxID=1802424 RepID=A0A1F7WEY1_9BACT|nr:MAG: hypothetical protein A2480_02340 [Candidatus Uhrbacteria bacterium RIFOXYC2_FULL_47_19]HCC22386.1 hypothetical protein [Candidatus Uhrbacteria bacterium]
MEMQNGPVGRSPAIGKRRWLAILGWAVFLLILALVLILGVKVFGYYRQIRSGNLVELPQYGTRLSVENGGNDGHDVALTETQSLLNLAGGPVIGPSSDDAKVNVVMFGDFECPFSKDSSTVFRRLSMRYGDRVRFTYLDFPLSSIHPSAALAAEAAECAGEQMRYWEYFDRLYGNSPALSQTDLLQYAREAGLDLEQFERCLNDGRFVSVVEADRVLAERLGLQGTPSFFIDGHRIEGAIPEQDFDRLLQSMIK